MPGPVISILSVIKPVACGDGSCQKTTAEEKQTEREISFGGYQFWNI